MLFSGLLQPEPLPQSTADLYPQETLRHNSVSVSVDLCVLLRLWFVWALWASLAGMRFDSKCEFMISPSYHLFGAFPLALDLGYLPNVTSAPYSCLSSSYHLAGASLTLDVGYFLKVTPALCNCCSSLRLDSAKSHPCEVPQSPNNSWSKDCWSWGIRSGA